MTTRIAKQDMSYYTLRVNDFYQVTFEFCGRTKYKRKIVYFQLTLPAGVKTLLLVQFYSLYNILNQRKAEYIKQSKDKQQ